MKTARISAETSCRFWQKVEKAADGCWNWTSVITDRGYGRFRIHGRMVRAHRLSFEMSNGRIPEGMQVLHRCDNRRCVNPEHLFLGTNAENMADKVAKGREAHYGHQGERNWRSKLTEEQVIFVRSASGSNTEIGRMFGVTRGAIRSIKIKKTWAHL